MEVCSLGPHVDLDNFLGVVPGPSGIGHEDRLKEAKEGDADEIPDEKYRAEKGECEGETEDRQKDVPHALLRIDRADPHHLLAVLDAGGGLRQIDVLLDEHHGTVGPGNHRLR